MFDNDTAPTNVFNATDTFLESEATFPIPDSDEFINDLDIWLLPADGLTIFDAVAQTQSPDGTLEHLFFQIPMTGEYKFWVRQSDTEEGLAGGQTYGVAWWAAAELTSFPQGDYNGDQVVDIQDYEAWSDQYGESETAGAGPDGNGDGVVNAADYVVWRKSFDAAGSGGGKVPEPGWAGMVVVGMALVVGNRPVGVQRILF
jgi:hypothetical protein